MLNIKKLNVGIEDKSIIKDLDFSLKAGEVHILMGPNGSGKSSLAHSLVGDPQYKVSGQCFLDEIDVLTLAPYERSLHGLFLAFQSPLEIPGVSLLSFLKTALNAHRLFNKQPLLDAADFIKEAKSSIHKVGLDESFLYRSLNDGFSGGEKKRCELLQLLLLKPKVVIFDETDSGLDVDAINILKAVIAELHDGSRSFLIITHYQHFLDMLSPDYVHIFKKGKILKSGGNELGKQVQEHGYKSFLAGA